MTFSEWIRSLRGVNESMLTAAGRFGVSEATWHAWEHRDRLPSDRALERIFDTLRSERRLSGDAVLPEELLVRRALSAARKQPRRSSRAAEVA